MSSKKPLLEYKLLSGLMSSRQINEAVAENSLTKVVSAYLKAEADKIKAKLPKSLKIQEKNSSGLKAPSMSSSDMGSPSVCGILLLPDNQIVEWEFSLDVTSDKESFSYRNIKVLIKASRYKNSRYAMSDGPAEESGYDNWEVSVPPDQSVDALVPALLAYLETGKK